MNPDEDWTHQAACRDHVSLFDVIVDNPVTAYKSGDVAEAVAVCRSCTVRHLCAQYAVEPVRNLHHGLAPRHGTHGV